MALLWLPLTVTAQEVVADTLRQDTLQQQGLTSETKALEPTVKRDSLIVMPQRLDSLLAKAQDVLRPQYRPDPTRALWLSLVFPGAGQVYNHKYWKLPVIYGGFLGCAYALSWNNQMLRDYTQAYLDIMDDDPNTKSYEKMLPMNYNIQGREAQFKEIFKNKKNYFRKYRDMSIFAFVGVYLISVIDAYVDAELSSFDISDDLSLHLSPAVFSNDMGRTPVCSMARDKGVGVALSIEF